MCQVGHLPELYKDVPSEKYKIYTPSVISDGGPLSWLIYLMKQIINTTQYLWYQGWNAFYTVSGAESHISVLPYLLTLCYKNVSYNCQ